MTSGNCNKNNIKSKIMKASAAVETIQNSRIKEENNSNNNQKYLYLIRINSNSNFPHKKNKNCSVRTN